MDDLKKAIQKLAVLGKGYQLIRFKEKEPYLLSVPIELNHDHEDLLGVAQLHGYVTFNLMRNEHNSWSKERFTLAVNAFLVEGIVWMYDYEGVWVMDLYIYIRTCVFACSPTALSHSLSLCLSVTYCLSLSVSASL